MISKFISNTFSHYSENIVYSIQSTFKQNKAPVITAIATLALCAFVATLCVIRNWRNKTYNQGIALYDQKKYQEAFPLLLISAQRGFREAQYKVAKLFDDGDGTKKDQKIAFFWYLKAAEQGDLSAQNDLACCYEDGVGVDQDQVKALYWYKKAADAGDLQAKYNLGKFYLKIGPHQNLNQGVLVLREAAEKGYSDAQNEMGIIYKFGELVKKDTKQAIYWFKEAIKQGNTIAKYNLAHLYLNDIENHDFNTALQLFKEAADEGDCDAQYNFGKFYFGGTGVEKNESVAMDYFRKAANQNHDGALLQMGLFYEEGNCVEKNLATAKLYYERAKEQGDEKAQLALERLK